MLDMADIIDEPMDDREFMTVVAKLDIDDIIEEPIDEKVLIIDDDMLEIMPDRELIPLIIDEPIDDREFMIEDVMPETMLDMVDVALDMALIIPDVMPETIPDMVVGKPAIALDKPETADDIVPCNVVVIDEAADETLAAMSDMVLPNADWMLVHKPPNPSTILSLTPATKLLTELTIQLDTLLRMLLNQPDICPSMSVTP